jgi:hypothetical protein
MLKRIADRIDLFRYASTGVQNYHWNKERLEALQSFLLVDTNAERLSPLIYTNSVKCDHFNSFSLEVQKWLRLNALAVVVSVEEKKRELQHLAENMAESKITLLLLKGMAFNQLIYKNEAPRGTSDIDLLIRKTELSDFEKKFSMLAYKVEHSSEHAFDGLMEETWCSIEANRVFFDIHWDLSYPTLFDFDGNEIFDRSVVHPFYKSEQLRMLSLEDHLVHLAIHLMKDCNFYDYGLLDCHQLICLEEPDIILCFKIAKKWGAKTSLFYLLSLSKKLLDTPICDKTLKNNKPNLLKHGICKLTIQYVFSKPAVLKSKFHRLQQIFVILFFGDNLARAFRHLTFYFSKRRS